MQNEEKLYLDPWKLRLWIASGGLLVLAFLLWFIPVYSGWVRVKEAEAEARAKLLLIQGPLCSPPTTLTPR